jgi:hypothetical protein
MARRIARYFTTEYVEGNGRSFGVITRPNASLVWEQPKGAIEVEADRLLKKRLPGAKPGNNNRMGIINSKTRAALGHIAWLLGAGFSIRRIAQITTVTRPTIRNHMKRMGLVAGYCKCGERGTHQGWCSYRVALSPARQSFLRRIGWMKESRGEGN